MAALRVLSLEALQRNICKVHTLTLTSFANANEILIFAC